MDYFRLNRLRESDFDKIVEQCGGRRAVEDDSKEKEENADYVLNEAIVELKLLEEEGLEKETRRRKVANLFRETQPDRPVVVLDPAILNDDSRRKYYNALEGPIKTHVKKAATQLFTTWGKHGKQHARVLLAFNNGYTALDHDEFASLVVKCAKNNTSKIDYVIAGGVCYYSDKFDSYFFSQLEPFPIHETVEFPSFDQLLECYQSYVEKQMTAMIRGEMSVDVAQLPVLDLDYEVDSVKFVKPAPRFGKPSEFYPEGKRPRENSTGIEKCPPVAMTFPKLSKEEWQKFKEALVDEEVLCDDYPSWCKRAEEESERMEDELRPFVFIEAEYDLFARWCIESNQPKNYSSLCEYVLLKFDANVKEIIHSAKSTDETRLIYPRYIRLLIEEIGQDKANDISSIYRVSEIPGLEREEVIIENKKLFYEYALAVASAYAIKHGVDVVLYERDETHCWV